MLQPSLAYVVLDALGAFALCYWVGIKGEWHDAITAPPWLRDYAREPHWKWTLTAPIFLLAMLVLLLWLGV